MYISLSPQVRDDRLTLERNGDSLVINGEEFDFSQLPSGKILPRMAVKCSLLASDIKRVDGKIYLTLILPIGLCAPEVARFPAPIIDPPNGLVLLPPCSEPKAWTAVSWSFPALITMTDWLRHRDCAGQSGRYTRSPSEDVLRCSIDAKSPTFRANPQGSETSERSGIRTAACC